MNSVVVKSKVGADGILHLEVPLGADSANAEVQVIIQQIPAFAGPIPPAGMNLKEYSDWLAKNIGTWQGPFERPEQGDYEKRDEL